MVRRVPLFLFALLVASAAAQDLGAQRLVYELPVDALQRALRERPNDDLERMLASMVATLHIRLGDDVTVRRDGAAGCVVVVPASRTRDIAAIRRLVEREASLELRITATGERREGEFAFDLVAERARLQTWLDAGGKELVLADTDAVRAFNSDSANGPLAGRKLQWRVHRVRPRNGDPIRWDYRLGDSNLGDACVPLFSDREWNGGRVPQPRPGEPVPTSLVELVALDFAQRGFNGDDIDPNTVGEVRLANGDAGVSYALRADLREAYGDWSKANVNRANVIVWNGEILYAPRFRSLIPGVGIISGTLPPTELADLARCLRAGALIAPPRFVRQEPAGAK